MDMHRITEMILVVSDDLHNKKFPINERVCVSPPPNYLDWFENYHPNVYLNRYYGPFFIQ